MSEELTSRMRIRIWMKAAFPVRLPISRNDLEEAGALEGYGISKINDAMNALKKAGLIENISLGIWRRVRR